MKTASHETSCTINATAEATLKNELFFSYSKIPFLSSQRKELNGVTPCSIYSSVCRSPLSPSGEAQQREQQHSLPGCPGTHSQPSLRGHTCHFHGENKHSTLHCLSLSLAPSESPCFTKAISSHPKGHQGAPFFGHSGSSTCLLLTPN